MRIAALAVAFSLIAFGPAACGGDSPDVTSPFGDLSGADQSRVSEVSEHTSRFSKSNAEFVAAISKERIAPARAAVDDAREALDDARQQVDGVENSELRGRMTTYFDALEDYADAANRFVAYYEVGEADVSTENELLKDLETTARAAQREDRAFLQTVIDAAPADQREAVRERAEGAKDEFERIAAP